ncbi:hypothetical protein HAX54_026454 [Datura stramonium]|uniref:Uncharacterized protein n=1 Tax=Datura stramonium TaxID=4076 RepID=A0ABS8V106_DATST|nr:hypothetical protein [Datura stramonium]
MMVEQVSGINLNGPSVQFTSVLRKRSKWWYAKRFLHPDVVAAYDYIFIWDEDLGVEHFNAEKEVHKDTEEKPGWCSDPHLPPCAAFVK